MSWKPCMLESILKERKHFFFQPWIRLPSFLHYQFKNRILKFGIELKAHLSQTNAQKRLTLALDKRPKKTDPYSFVSVMKEFLQTVQSVQFFFQVFVVNV